jgi:hypothetical protein
MPERILALDALDRVAPWRFEQPDLKLHRLDDLGATVVPQWLPQEIPQRRLMPLIDGVDPTIIENKPPIAVCPESHVGILWFTPTTLSLTDFALTVRRQVRPDGSIAVSGGSAVISVSVYIGQPIEYVERSRLKWAEKVPLPEARARQLNVMPAPEYGLAVDLQLPAGTAAEPPIITVSQLAGSATIAVELTEAGVLAWRSALEHGVPGTITGAVRASVAIPTTDPDNWYPGVERRVLDTPLGTLLAGRGAADIRQIDPQQTVVATVIVVGSQLVTSTTVALRPSGGQAPTSSVFGAAGGRADVSVVTQDPSSVSVGWRADVAFTPPRWPVVPATGQLDATSGWITMIKPESWCVGYLLAVVPVDASGRPVPASTRQGDRVQGVLNFTAPYVDGGLLSSTFEAEYGRPTSLVLPRYPGRPFGDLVLTVFVTCGGTLGQASRRLGEDDVVVTALAFPDGRVTLHTATDALPEASTGLPAQLRRLRSLASG